MSKVTFDATTSNNQLVALIRKGGADAAEAMAFLQSRAKAGSKRAAASLDALAKGDKVASVGEFFASIKAGAKPAAKKASPSKAKASPAASAAFTFTMPNGLQTDAASFADAIAKASAIGIKGAIVKHLTTK